MPPAQQKFEVVGTTTKSGNSTYFGFQESGWRGQLFTKDLQAGSVIEVVITVKKQG
jgi:hypothetical protein